MLLEMCKKQKGFTQHFVYVGTDENELKIDRLNFQSRCCVDFS